MFVLLPIILFTGILLLNFFYWTTNQQIIQRTFGASSLAEGQKGVLLTGALKLLGPLYLVLPGLIAFALFFGDDIKPDQAYGKRVNRVLPPALTGFFAAAMIGAVLSSFNSALNSSCTLFSLGLYKGVLKKDATDEQVVRSGKIFGWIIATAAMCIAIYAAFANFSTLTPFGESPAAAEVAPVVTPAVLPEG